jgi:hypothetical protein
MISMAGSGWSDAKMSDSTWGMICAISINYIFSGIPAPPPEMEGFAFNYYCRLKILRPPQPMISLTGEEYRLYFPSNTLALLDDFSCLFRQRIHTD